MNMHIVDRTLKKVILGCYKKLPILSITGPRQSGKTTLCRDLFPKVPYINLEDLEKREFAKQDPKGFLSLYPKGAIIDEIQRVPQLTSYLQVIVDEPSFDGFFVLTGSQNFGVINTLSQSLAGRVHLFQLLPFSFSEISYFSSLRPMEELIFSGFYPRIHHKKLDPTKAYDDYVATYLERDLRQLELIKKLDLFQKFLRLVAGRVGQVINMQSLSNDVGVAQSTIREWITLLEASFILYKLPPYFENVGKRLIKSPKIYFYDVGVLCFLLGIQNPSQIQTHPLRGSLFENMIISEYIKQSYHEGIRPQYFFYRDSNGNEVDLLIPDGNNLKAIEIKSSQTITTDFFKGLEIFKKTTKKKTSLQLIYAGKEKRTQKGITITPYDKKL